MPYNVIDNAKINKSKSTPKSYPCEITENLGYLTKSFLIRFCEETSDINEICQFRTEIEAYPTLNESNLYFDCDLLFFDTVNSPRKYNLVIFLAFF